MRSKLATVLRSILVIFACAFLFFAQAMPAYSATSSPTKGEDQLLGIEKESQKIIQSGEPTPQRKETQEKSSGGGLNGVQGTADAEKMNNPANSGGETVEKDLGDALNKVAK